VVEAILLNTTRHFGDALASQVRLPGLRRVCSAGPTQDVRDSRHAMEH